MANPQQKKPPLEEAFSTPEIFATEVPTIAVVHGNVILTLGELRMEEAGENVTPRVRRIVKGRIILTGEGANQLMAQMQRMAVNIQHVQAQQAAGGPINKPKAN